VVESASCFLFPPRDVAGIVEISRCDLAKENCVAEDHAEISRVIHVYEIAGVEAFCPRKAMKCKIVKRENYARISQSVNCPRRRAAKIVRTAICSACLNIYATIKSKNQTITRERVRKKFLIKFNDMENCVIDYQVLTWRERQAWNVLSLAAFEFNAFLGLIRYRWRRQQCSWVDTNCRERKLF
jgi:hypothetical protein